MKQKKAIYKVLITSIFILIFMFFNALTCSAEGELIINRTWLDGDILRIEATDINGVTTTLALRLADYVNDTQNEFISIQAADLNGNKSGIMQIKNPYYLPLATTGETSDITVAVIPPEQSGVQNGSNAFTPDGTGTVMDNVTNSDGKEFFTVGTEDGSFFYLIVDRERNSDNVYLLNAVTEEDLRSLAQKNGKTIESEHIPTENITKAVTETPAVTATETRITTAPVESVTEAETTTEIVENDSETEKKNGKEDNNFFAGFLANADFTMLIIIVVVMGVAGAAIFIIKRRKKNNQFYTNDDDDYEYSENTDTAVEQKEDNNDKSEENEEIVNANSEITEQKTPENDNQNQNNDGDNDENNFEDGDDDVYN